MTEDLTQTAINNPKTNEGWDNHYGGGGKRTPDFGNSRKTILLLRNYSTYCPVEYRRKSQHGIHLETSTGVYTKQGSNGHLHLPKRGLERSLTSQTPVQLPTNLVDACTGAEVGE